MCSLARTLSELVMCHVWEELIHAWLILYLNSLTLICHLCPFPCLETTLGDAGASWPVLLGEVLSFVIALNEKEFQSDIFIKCACKYSQVPPSSSSSSSSSSSLMCAHAFAFIGMLIQRQ